MVRNAIYRDIFDQLHRWREQAEIESRVPRSTSIYYFIRNVLRTLLGHDQSHGGGFNELDDAVRHFVRHFVINPKKYPPIDPEPEQLVAEVLNEEPTSSGSG